MPLRTQVQIKNWQTIPYGVQKNKACKVTSTVIPFITPPFGGGEKVIQYTKACMLSTGAMECYSAVLQHVPPSAWWLK